MIIVAVLLLQFFISVKSSNTTHDAGTFHQITKINGENLYTFTPKSLTDQLLARKLTFQVSQLRNDMRQI